VPPLEAIGQDTPEEDVAALVDALRRDPAGRDALVELLPERARLYAGRSANATARLRGWILAAFEEVGLPDAALPYVLDELQNGRHAYLVAAAARALRGLERPTGHAVPFLLQAIRNIRDADDALSFDSFRPGWPAPDATTATEEVLRTLAWLGSHAIAAGPELEALREDEGALSAPARTRLEAVLAGLGNGQDHCCGHDESPVSLVTTGLSVTGDSTPAAGPAPAQVELEDQDGHTLTFGEFFGRVPSVVVFFYTRCDNPNKCSLTITRLAGLQRALRHEGLEERLRTAAITYDPGFDLPPRLRAYGENRGVAFGDGHRFLRTRDQAAGFERLREYFGLGVNFGPTLVNRHRIELFLLDRECRIAVTFARLRWDAEAVLAQALALVGAGSADHR
jgi:protein SCO1/2